MLLARLQKIPGVSSAQQDTLWLQKLNALIKLGKELIYAVSSSFALAVLLVIGNTIRLSMQKYQREIAITKLLGATSRFIRCPFIYSGIIYGLVGSIIAWLLIDIIILWLQNPITQVSTLYNSTFQLHSIGLNATIFLLVSGVALGYVGSRLVVSRQIKAAG